MLPKGSPESPTTDGGSGGGGDGEPGPGERLQGRLEKLQEVMGVPVSSRALGRRSEFGRRLPWFPTAFAASTYNGVDHNAARRGLRLALEGEGDVTPPPPQRNQTRFF